MNATMVELGVEAGQAGAIQPLLYDWDVWQVRDLNALSVRFRLNERARVTITLEPLNGGFTKLLYDAPSPAGEFSETWRFNGKDARPAAPGVYLISMKINGEASAETLVIKS